MKNELPSDQLTKPRRPLRTALIAAATAVALTGIGVGAAVAAPVIFPTPTPTATSVFVPVEQTGAVNRAPYVTPDQQAAADKQVADMEAAAAQKAAEEAAAQKAAADAAAKKAAQQAPKKTETSAGLPAGSPVPSIPGTTSPDTSKCASGTASDVNGVPTCL